MDAGLDVGIAHNELDKIMPMSIATLKSLSAEFDDGRCSQLNDERLVRYQALALEGRSVVATGSADVV